MAYAFASASSQNITAASAIVSDYPVTVACWSLAASASATYRNIGIINNTADNRLVALGFINGAVSVAAVAGNGSNSDFGTFSANAYFHAVAKMPSTTSRTPYLNGSAGTTDTGGMRPTGYDRFAIGGYITAFLNGNNAEVAIWSVALTDAEIVSLAKGFKPTRIRPQSLVFYAPLVRNLQDVRAGLALTNNNTATVADHPRVY